VELMTTLQVTLKEALEFNRRIWTNVPRSQGTQRSKTSWQKKSVNTSESRQ